MEHYFMLVRSLDPVKHDDRRIVNERRAVASDGRFVTLPRPLHQGSSRRATTMAQQEGGSRTACTNRVSVIAQGAELPCVVRGPCGVGAFPLVIALALFEDHR